MRLVASLLLLLCAGWTEAKEERTQQLLERGLRKDVEPCDNFYRHTCNMDDPVIKNFARYQGNYLVEDAAKLILEKDDVLMNRLVRAFKKVRNLTSSEEYNCRWRNFSARPEPSNKGDHTVGKDSGFFNYSHIPKPHNYNDDIHEVGKFIGELIAYGRKTPFEFYCTSRHRCKIGHNEAKKYTTKQFSEMWSKLYRGIVAGYFYTMNMGYSDMEELVITHPADIIEVDMDALFGQAAWWENNRFVQEMAEFFESNQDRVKNHVRFSMTDQVSRPFAPYFNVLYSRTMYKHPEVFHPEMTDEFEVLAEKIVDEISLAIESSDWFRTSRVRDRLVRDLRRVQIHIGIPKYHRNLHHLTDLLDSLLFPEVGAVKDNVAGNCELEMLSRAVAVARNRVVFRKQEMGTISPYAWKIPSSMEENLFNSRDGFHIGHVISIYPGTLHFLHGNYSLGFKYGYAATLIAHELFHHLGLTRNKDRPHLYEVLKTDHFKEAQACYIEYYGSFCTDDECPNGEFKADEGYCDVEGTRVVIRVLKKALRQWSHKIRTRRAGEDEEFPMFGSDPMQFLNADPNDHRLLQDSDAAVFKQELKWLFYGMQFANCEDPAHATEYDAVLGMFGNKRPRKTIRTEAAVRQIKEFSEGFQCKEDDANYVLPDNRICEAYPLLTMKFEMTAALDGANSP